MGSPQRGEVTTVESIDRENTQSTGPPIDPGLPVHRNPSTTTPIEMTEIEEHPPNDSAQIPQTSHPSITTNAIHQKNPSFPSKPDQPETQLSLAADLAPAPLREPLAITSVTKDTNLMAGAPYPLMREKTGPAIGPSLDKPAPLHQESDVIGPSLLITLLLITGARHPYKIDEKYLKKRNVNVDENDPVNMSVYTLKELIWREWRDGEHSMTTQMAVSAETEPLLTCGCADWEIRPSSPSAIRLIYYGKMLEDKSRLHGEAS